MNRYTMESLDLAILARRQLNLPKNVIKPNFEDMELIDILDKLYEEMQELIQELFTHALPHNVQKSEIDFERVEFELGDCAACLVGVLAKIESMKGVE